MKEMMMNLVREEEGQAMVEYGLIIALVAAIAIIVFGTLSTSLQDIFTDIGGKLTGAI